MTDTQFLKDRYDAQRAIIDLGLELSVLSMDFFQTGNVVMAERLYEMSSNLIASLRAIDGAFDTLFHLYTGAVDQGSKNMMDMALALSNLAGGEK